MTILSAPQVLTYESYRSWLRDWFAAAKAESGKVSLEWVGQRLGVSRMFVKYVLDEKKHLSRKHLPTVVSLMKLKGRDTQYFRALYNLNRSKASHERAEAMKDLLKARGHLMQAHYLDKEDEGMFSHWSTTAILQLRHLDGYRPCPTWIKAQLMFRASTSEIAEGIKIVERFYEKRAHNSIKSDAPIKLPDGFVSEIYKQYAKDLILLAAQAIDSQPREDRQMFNFTVSIPEHRFKEAKDMVEEFRHQLHATFDNMDKCERVLQVNCQLFTLAKCLSGEDLS